MRAWRVQQYGHYRDELHLEDDVAVPFPPALPRSSRVLAAGVNFSDILAIAGKYVGKGDASPSRRARKSSARWSSRVDRASSVLGNTSLR